MACVFCTLLTFVAISSATAATGPACVDGRGAGSTTCYSAGIGVPCGTKAGAACDATIAACVCVNVTPNGVAACLCR
jgi:gamma-glutamyltranspeptidase